MDTPKYRKFGEDIFEFVEFIPVPSPKGHTVKERKAELKAQGKFVRAIRLTKPTKRGSIKKRKVTAYVLYARER